MTPHHNMLWLDAFLDDLEDGTRLRLERDQPQMKSDRLSRECLIEVLETDNKYIFINIGGKTRFAVERKSAKIYLVERGNINKKKSYDTLKEHDQFDWSSYYPYRKRLYDWNNNKEINYDKSGNVTEERPILATREAEGSWPYTAAVGGALRTLNNDTYSMGKQRTADTRSRPENDHGADRKTRKGRSKNKSKD